jgi:hypothetical protein
LNILSGWQIGVDNPAARANLLMNAEAFPDLRFIAAACFLKIGDLYTEEGNLAEATSYYLRVAEDTSPEMAQYRILAEERGTETTLILNSVGTFNGEAAPEQAGPQTSFAPGEAIRYAASIMNTGSSTVTASLDYLVTGPKEIFSLTEDIAIPPDPPEGGWSIYATTTVPTDAPSGTYTLRVTMTTNGQSSTKESSFTVLGGSEQPPAAISRIPEGKAPNLIVYVHGCCTNEEIDKDVTKIRNQLWEAYKGQAFVQSGEWEIVVWDWTKCTSDPNVECTPKPTIWQVPPFKRAADIAYIHALSEGKKLAAAIAHYSYDYVHLIAHSAGAKLIDEAALQIALNNIDQPFLHITFLDAYTRDDNDKINYGGLPVGYPRYVEHYVDRGLPDTNTCLLNAFNFDISRWKHSPTEILTLGHHWPIHWYQQSVTSTSPKFKYGYPLSLEGSGKDIDELVNELAQYPAGQQCGLDTGLFNENPNPDCQPAACWK